MQPESAGHACVYDTLRDRIFLGFEMSSGGTSLSGGSQQPDLENYASCLSRSAFLQAPPEISGVSAAG